MLLVKITILLIVITAIFLFLIRVHLTNNITELMMLHHGLNKKWYVRIFGILVLIDILLAFISLVWFLFFR